MRNIITFILFLSLVFPVRSHAEALTLWIAGSIALHGGVAGVLAYFSTPTATAKGSTNGAGSSTGAALLATAVWVELSGTTPVLKSAPVTASTSLADLQSYASGAAVGTPLFDALNATVPTPAAGSVRDNPINGQRQKIASTGYSCGYGSTWTNTNDRFTSSTNYRDMTQSTANPIYYSCMDYMTTLTTENLSPDNTTAPKNATDALTGLASPSASVTAGMKSAVEADNSPDYTDCPSSVWSNGDYVQVSGCTPHTVPVNAVTPEQQNLAAAVGPALTAYNNAASAYNANPSAANLSAVNGARSGYNGAATALNNSLAASGAAGGAATIPDGTTGTVTPPSPPPVGDPVEPPAPATTSPVFGSYSGSGQFNSSARFKSFFDDMKTTSLFSIPGQFVGSIPTGGSSLMSFNGGRFGEHTFDFEKFSAVFLTFKSIFLVVCTWVGLRIVTKGGA